MSSCYGPQKSVIIATKYRKWATSSWFYIQVYRYFSIHKKTNSAISVRKRTTLKPYTNINMRSSPGVWLLTLSVSHCTVAKTSKNE
jgi:hypothetical protein